METGRECSCDRHSGTDLVLLLILLNNWKECHARFSSADSREALDKKRPRIIPVYLFWIAIRERGGGSLFSRLA